MNPTIFRTEIAAQAEIIDGEGSVALRDPKTQELRGRVFVESSRFYLDSWVTAETLDALLGPGTALSFESLIYGIEHDAAMKDEGLSAYERATSRRADRVARTKARVFRSDIWVADVRRNSDGTYDVRAIENRSSSPFEKPGVVLRLSMEETNDYLVETAGQTLWSVAETMGWDLS